MVTWSDPSNDTVTSLLMSMFFGIPAGYLATHTVTTRHLEITVSSLNAKQTRLRGITLYLVYRHRRCLQSNSTNKVNIFAYYTLQCILKA